jgi:hypothetical protein
MFGSLQREGYFVPPITANYTFYFASDDYGDLYLSPSDNASAIVFVCGSFGFRSTYYQAPEQISTPIWLLGLFFRSVSLLFAHILALFAAGHRYFVRARHQEAYGGDFFTAAVRIWNSSALKTPEEIRYHSVHELQTITISTVVVRQVTNINIVGASGGSFSVLGDKCVAGPFDVTSSSASIASGIASCMKTCGSISVSRIAKPANLTFSYNVTFSCPTAAPYVIRGLNTGLTVAANASFVSIDTAVVVSASQPLTGSVNIGLDNAWMGFLPITSSYLFAAALQSISTVGNLTVQISGNAQDSLSLIIEFLTLKVCCCFWFACVDGADDCTGQRGAIERGPVDADGHQPHQRDVNHSGWLSGLLLRSHSSSVL